MSKFNTTTGSKPVGTSPITSETSPSGRTYEGAAGYTRDTKSELFLLAVSNMVDEATFYEASGDRNNRFQLLVRAAAILDGDWTARFLGWLRNEAHMRTAALVGAAEFVKVRRETLTDRVVHAPKAVTATPGRTTPSDTPVPANDERGLSRQVIDSVLQRADEPGELLAYWVSRYGRKIPKPVKRGIGDAVQRLYDERALLKYDTPTKGFRFGDVLELTHPDARAPWQADLFRHAIDRRHNNTTGYPVSLRALAQHRFLMDLPVGERRGFIKSLHSTGEVARLAAAGITWEALAGWLQGPMDAVAWEAVIPSMGLMALTRNLRNFDQAGVSDTVAAQVMARLADPGQVAKSRQFPFRFWSAYKHTDSLRWAHALDQAINHSLANVPSLPGRTLVLVDRSPSMFPGFPYSTPNTSDIPLAEQAALFGAAVALRAADATLVEFGGQSRQVTVARGGSVLRLTEAFGQISGTDIPAAVITHFTNHDRVIVITDEQTRAGYLPSNMARSGGMSETTIDALIPGNVPVYMWNMAGYKPGAAPSGSRNRHTFGGLTDHAFRMIPLLEAGRDADWPF